MLIFILEVFAMLKNLFFAAGILYVMLGTLFIIMSYNM